MNLNCATKILGKSEERYFSNGFKSFDFNFYNVKSAGDKIEGYVEISYKALSAPKPNKERHLHLGTMEYLAMGGNISEHALRVFFNLDDEQLSKSWISYSKMKINSSVPFKSAVSLKVKKINIPFSCLKINTIKSSVFNNNVKSCFHIRVDNVLIIMEVDHPFVTDQAKVLSHLDSINFESIYNYGYKKRSFDIKDIFLSKDDMTCYANIHLHNSYLDKSGLGSCYDSIIMPDIISVTGQLTQILLYALENLKREEANNLWLREMEINYSNPYCRNKYKNNIKFYEYKIIPKKESIWRTVNLEARIGNIMGKFKVAHLLPLS